MVFVGGLQYSEYFYNGYSHFSDKRDSQGIGYLRNVKHSIRSRSD